MTPVPARIGLLLAVGLAAPLQADAGAHWPEWRGPLGTGASATATPPVAWSEDDNLRWRTRIPGRGTSSPVVWGDRVFVTTAVAAESTATRADTAEGNPYLAASGALSYRLLALDAASGRVLWSRTAAQGVPHEGTHAHGSWASGSPVTDGRRVCAFFGSRGIHCYDLEGRLLWQRDFGDQRTRLGFGEGSSPRLAGARLIVPWDHEGDSFLAALDLADGAERWRVTRMAETSWTTPDLSAGRILAVDGAGVEAYDAESGARLWTQAGEHLNRIASPLTAGGLVFAVSSFEAGKLLALRAADGAVAWSCPLSTPYVSTPLAMDGRLWLVKADQGILYCVDAVTGELLYGPERLPGVRGVYASPAGAAGRVYVAGLRGATAVVGAGPAFELLAVNVLDDGFTASPALAGDALYLRGERFLYCLATAP